MNKKTLITMLLAIVVVTGWAQKKFNLQGTAHADVKTVYIYNSLSMRGTPDSVAVVNGKWEYSAQPTLPTIRVITSSVFDRQKLNQQMNIGPIVAVMADSVPTVVDLTDCTVKGSKASVAINNTLRGLLDCMKRDSKDDALKLMRNVVMDNLDSMIPLEFVPMVVDGLTVGDLQRIFYPGAPYADDPSMKQAKDRLAQLTDNSVCSVGKQFIDLTLNDTEGKPHKLSEYCGKGRYVLIDFWASWCGPCRSEMPNVTYCYDKYHEKGFDIVALSFDSKKEDWLRAINTMKMPWTHLSDLAGWKSIAATTYGIKGIPSNILLDGEGKIVDCDLHGIMLELRLDEIFGDK